MTDKAARFEEIVAHGNRYFHGDETGALWDQPNWITCRDGFRLSVVAGQAVNCLPRVVICRHERRELPPPTLGFYEVPCTYQGPYTHVEVLPETGDIPEWGDYETSGVYSRVPVEEVRELIDRHGGQA